MSGHTPASFQRAMASTELVAALKSARLMLYAWRGARIERDYPDDHGELNGTIAEVEAALQKAGAL